MPDTHYAITIPVASQIHPNGQIATTSSDTTRHKTLSDFTAISGPLFIKLKLTNVSAIVSNADEQTIVEWLTHPQLLWHLFQSEFIIIMRTRRKLTGKIDETPILMDLRYEITGRNLLDNIDTVLFTWSTDLHTFTRHIDSTEITEILSQDTKLACRTIIHDASAYVARTSAQLTADKQKTKLIDRLFDAKTYHINIKYKIDNIYAQNMLLNETLILIDSAYSAFHQLVKKGSTTDINDFIDTKLVKQISILRDAGIVLTSLSRTNEVDLAKAYDAKDSALYNKLCGRSIVLAKLEEKLNPTLSRTSTSTRETTTHSLSRKVSTDPYRTDTRISPESLENHTYLTAYKATHGGDYVPEISVALINTSEASISISYQYISPQELEERYDGVTPPTRIFFRAASDDSIEIKSDAESYKLILKITRILVQTEICKYRANAKLTKIVLENKKYFYELKDTHYITMHEQVTIKKKNIKNILKKIEIIISNLYSESYIKNIDDEKFFNILNDINVDIINLFDNIHITKMLIQELSGIFTKVQDKPSIDLFNLYDRVLVFKQELRKIIQLNGIDPKEKHVFLTYFHRPPLSITSTDAPPISSSSQPVNGERMRAEQVRETHPLTPIAQRELTKFCPPLDGSSSSEDERSSHDSSEVLNSLETISPNKKINTIEPDVINGAVDNLFSIEKDLFTHVRHLFLYKKNVPLNYEEWESTFLLIVNTLTYLQENFRLWINDFNSLLDADITLLPPMLINKVLSINENLLKIVDNCIERIKCQMQINMDITINAELISLLDSLGTLRESPAQASCYTSTSTSTFNSQSVTFTIDSSYGEQQLRRLHSSISRFQQSLVTITTLYESYHQLQTNCKPIVKFYPNLSTKGQTYLQPFMAILGHIPEGPQVLPIGYYPDENEAKLDETEDLLTHLLATIQIRLTPPPTDSFLATQGISCQYQELLQSACRLFPILASNHRDEIHSMNATTSINTIYARLQEINVFNKITFDTLVKLIKSMSENYTYANQTLQELGIIEVSDSYAIFFNESLSQLIRNLRTSRVISTIESQLHNMIDFNNNLFKQTSFKFEPLQSSSYQLVNFLWLFDRSLHKSLTRIEQYFKQINKESMGPHQAKQYSTFEKLARALAAVNNDKSITSVSCSNGDQSPIDTETFWKQIIEESCKDKGLNILRDISNNLDTLISVEELASILLTIQQLAFYLQNEKTNEYSFIHQNLALYHNAMSYLHIKLLFLASEALEVKGYLPVGLALFATAIGVFDGLIAFLVAKQALQKTLDINPGQTDMPTESSSSAPLAPDNTFTAESFLNFFSAESQPSSSTESSGFQRNGINIRGINNDQFTQIIDMMTLLQTQKTDMKAALQAQKESGGLARSRSSSTIRIQDPSETPRLHSASVSSVSAASKSRQYPTRTSLVSLQDTTPTSGSSLFWQGTTVVDDPHRNGDTQRIGKTPHSTSNRSTTRD